MNYLFSLLLVTWTWWFSFRRGVFECWTEDVCASDGDTDSILVKIGSSVVGPPRTANRPPLNHSVYDGHTLSGVVGWSTFVDTGVVP